MESLTSASRCEETTPSGFDTDCFWHIALSDRGAWRDRSGVDKGGEGGRGSVGGGGVGGQGSEKDGWEGDGRMG